MINEISKSRFLELRKMMRFVKIEVLVVFEMEGMITKYVLLLERTTCLLYSNNVSKKYFYEER